VTHITQEVKSMNTTPEPPSGAKLLYTTTDAGKMLGGVSRAEVVRLIGRGSLRAVKIGRLTRVPHSALLEYVQRLEHDSVA
jgi:excisionase family DNA binding protein